MTRLQEDYRQTAGRLWEDDRKTTGRALCVSGPVLREAMQRFRAVSAKPAKRPRSHHGPTSMLRSLEAQPCPLSATFAWTQLDSTT